MYIPTAFREDNLETLVAFMQAHSFATLISLQPSETTAPGYLPVASHIPLVVSVDNGVVKLTGHLAKQNPQWQWFHLGEALAIFSGPHGYVSPSVYEKVESVPTWNYIAVHAYGQPRLLTLGDGAPEHREVMDGMIAEMIHTYEPAYQDQWDGLSEGFRTGMMQGIVGLEINVARLEGKYKLSQNRSSADQQAVAHFLLAQDDQASHAIATAMQQPPPNLENRDTTSDEGGHLTNDL